MDIREFTTYNEKSPCTGYGVWIVLEEKDRKAQLLHPIFLTELIVSEYDYARGSGGSVWPINTTTCSFDCERFIKSFKNRIAFFLENGRSFPVQSVAKALAQLTGITHDEAMSFIGKASVNEYGESISKVSNKASREYAVRKDVDVKKFTGRPEVILSALKENGPASIYQITSMVDGKLKTKSDLNRVVTYFVNKLASEGVLEILA